jgi:holo-[acyl-carrier protein] synthase
MIVQGLGIDLVEVDRISSLMERTGETFKNRIFTAEEVAYCDSNANPAIHYAARWAAKEAVIKAWSGSRFAQRPKLTEAIYRDIEVITDMWGRPKVRLTGEIADHLADVVIHVSLTHEGDTAAAVAILEAP